MTPFRMSSKCRHSDASRRGDPRGGRDIAFLQSYQGGSLFDIQHETNVLSVGGRPARGAFRRFRMRRQGPEGSQPSPHERDVKKSSQVPSAALGVFFLGTLEQRSVFIRKTRRLPSAECLVPSAATGPWLRFFRPWSTGDGWLPSGSGFHERVMLLFTGHF